MRHHNLLMIAGVLCAASVSAQTPTPTGPAPIGFDVLVNSPSSVRATWTRGTNVSAYMVARYRSSNLTTPERQSAWMTSTTTSWDDPGLVGGVTYVYRLAARYTNNTYGVAEKTVPLPVIADAPAPVLGGIGQHDRSIGADVCFTVPPNTTTLSLQRQREGNSTIQMVTPAPIPLSALTKCGQTVYLLVDTTLTATGKYYYSVVGNLSDGRTGTSAWSTYTPVLGAPTNVTVTKRDHYTAVVSFNGPGGTMPAGFKMDGTGLPAAGMDVPWDLFTTPVTVVMPNLAAGTYTWYVKTVWKPGLFSGAVPVTVTMP